MGESGSRGAAAQDSGGRGRPAAPPPAVARPGTRQVTLVGSPPSPCPALERILEGGGVGEVIGLRSAPLVLGRDEGDLRFPEDGRLSGRHASVRIEGEGLRLRDLGSKNGTFRRGRERIALADGTECILGNTLLRFRVATGLPATAALDAPAPKPGTPGLRVIVVGTNAPDSPEIPLDDFDVLGGAGTTLDLSDEFVSPGHARVQIDGGKAWLIDQRSANGIYERIPPEQDVVLAPGEMFRIGRQVFRFGRVVGAVEPGRAAGGPATTAQGPAAAGRGGDGTGGPARSLLPSFSFALGMVAGILAAVAAVAFFWRPPGPGPGPGPVRVEPEKRPNPQPDPGPKPEPPRQDNH